MSKVKDMSLAPEGVRKIEWVQKHMPVLESIKKEYEETQPRTKNHQLRFDTDGRWS